MDKKAKHNQRMAKKKEIVDARIAEAQQERGILLLLKGNGKGKSSSAFGTMARAVGHGKRVAVLQFTKGWDDTGEYLLFKDHDLIDWYVMGHGFTWETQNFDQDKAAAEKAWDKAAALLKDERYFMVVLDEMTYSIKYKYLDADVVSNAIQNRPKDQTVIVTGRAMPKELEAIADTISEVKDLEHAFRKGVKAQAGIEF